MVQEWDNVLVVKDTDTHVPVSIDRCTKAPDGRNHPPNPNKTDQSQHGEDHTTTESVQLNDDGVTTPQGAYTELQDVSSDAQQVMAEDEAIGNTTLEPYIIRIVDHTSHMDGRITFQVQTSDTLIRKNVDRDDIPSDLLLDYYHAVTNPKKNPHLRRRGRPPKERGTNQHCTVGSGREPDYTRTLITDHFQTTTQLRARSHENVS